MTLIPESALLHRGHVQRRPSPSRPTEGAYVDEIFGASGPFAERFPDYQPREQQVAYAREVDRAIYDNANLLAEGPTGVGKSVGYLVPAIRHAIAGGKKVIVCTANIALQEQLVMKDLPLLRELLPWPFTYALAKGRQNYACLDRLSEEKLFPTVSFASRDEQEQWREILGWSDITSTGDLSELPFVPSAGLRQRLTVGSDDCTGKACNHYEECYANKARQRFKEADVVVANYHLFFSDLKVRLASDGNASILPEWGVLIADEAHKLADVCRDFMGFRITAGSIRHAARLLAPSNDKTPTIDPVLKERLSFEADEYFARLRAYRRSGEYKSRIARKGAVQSAALVEQLHKACDEYERAMSGGVGSEVREKLRLAHRRCENLAESFENVGELKDPDKVAYFIEEEGDRVALRAKLVHVRDVLREHVWSLGNACILTSATLAVSGNFDYPTRELGCEGARELVVESPFDFERNAMLIVPDRTVMPDLSSKNPKEKAEYPRAAAEALVECVRQADGRTLGLFTSKKALQEAASVLQRSGWEGRILVQYTAPRTQLVQEFRDDVRSVLLGTESFWEGVDVPGKSLSVLVIDKLPFPSPDDPVLDAVEASCVRGAFEEWSLPRAVIAFRQGVGRLIRSVTDRGVVVCLDRRLVEKGYGRKFTRSLPRMRYVRHLDEIGFFLRGEHAA